MWQEEKYKDDQKRAQVATQETNFYLNFMGLRNFFCQGPFKNLQHHLQAIQNSQQLARYRFTEFQASLVCLGQSPTK